MTSITVPAPGSSAPQQFETSPLHAFPKAKLTAFSRLKNFASGLRVKKESHPQIDFPPPSWFVSDESKARTDAQTTKDSAGAAHTLEAERDAPEPKTFAVKIRQLIDLLPLPASSSAAVGVGHSAGTEELNTGQCSALQVHEKGPPIPDVVDARTRQLLTSEEVMNGDDACAQGSRRQSVWSALEGLRYESVAAEENGTGPSPAGKTEHEEGVMMYAPLEPTAESELELADSELGHIDEPRTGEDAAKAKGKAVDARAPPITHPPTPGKHWVPSTTKISVFTTWWGYRLYLPPPIMAVLNSNQMKATQRAAMITTALQWFLTKVPMVIIPPQVKPAVTVLRRLSPLLGYIGVFIAWSWGRISACDKGNGVVLTATWLLPVALIPMSWDAGDIHGPPNRPPIPVYNGTSPSSKDEDIGKKIKK